MTNTLELSELDCESRLEGGEVLHTEIVRWNSPARPPLDANLTHMVAWRHESQRQPLVCEGYYLPDHGWHNCHGESLENVVGWANKPTAEALGC